MAGHAVFCVDVAPRMFARAIRVLASVEGQIVAMAGVAGTLHDNAPVEDSHRGPGQGLVGIHRIGCGKGGSDSLHADTMGQFGLPGHSERRGDVCEISERVAVAPITQIFEGAGRTILRDRLDGRGILRGIEWSLVPGADSGDLGAVDVALPERRLTVLPRYQFGNREMGAGQAAEEVTVLVDCAEFDYWLAATADGRDADVEWLRERVSA